jgi:hypothetical protein
MNIRKIIREELSRLFEDDAADGSLFGGALTDISSELEKDLANVGIIIKTHQTDMKNMDNQIKSDLQLKSKLNAQDPHKKGLEREIPEKQKDYEVRKKQLKDLEDAQKGMSAAQKEIEKQKLDLEKQSSQSQSGQADSTPSVLPSLNSPI